MTEQNKALRIVPSGQIYRQMFDAQFQLSRNLSRYYSGDKERRQKPETEELIQGGSLPVIRLNKDDTQHGILTNRQKSWASGFPNDPYLENPVLYKQFKNYCIKKTEETEPFLGEKEVRRLPDIVVSKKEGSDILQRLANGRKEKHEEIVEEMYQELRVINSTMEPNIEQVSKELLQKLNENDSELTKIMEKIEEDENLLSYSYDDLEKFWEKVAANSPTRRDLIANMDSSLKEAEEKRMQKIRRVFETYGEKLQKVSHLMLPDLQRFMDKETQLINQTTLSNRRALSDLYVRLTSADVEREKTLRNEWRRRLEDWKGLNTKIAIEEFYSFMKDDKITSSEGIMLARENMVLDLDSLNQNRIDLIKTLLDLKPPASTKTNVSKWRKDLKDLNKEIDTCMQKALSVLQEEYESVCRKCLEKIEEIKNRLIEAKVWTSHRAAQVIDEFMLPLVGERQRIFEEEIQRVENKFYAHFYKMEESLTSLFKFAQGAASLWDVHQLDLHEKERHLQDGLDKTRQDHNADIQEKEANLDIVMDRMRQDSTEMALKDSLLKALTMLENIRELYVEFLKTQEDVVEKYPGMIDTTLNKFQQAVCDFFSVEKKQDEAEQSETSTEKETTPPITIITEEGTEYIILQEKKEKQPPIKVDKRSSYKSGKSENALVASESKSKSVKDETSKSEQTLADKSQSEVAYYDDATLSDEIMEDIVEIGVEEEPDDYIDSIDIPKFLIQDIKKAIRLNFLNYLDLWNVDAVERAKTVVAAKLEELNSELDLRLHLHWPRPRRVELDIHNVRAAELVLHSERVSRHSTGMNQKLEEVQNKFKEMSQEHNKLAKKFQQDIEKLEDIFVNATKSSRIVNLQNQISMELEKFMNVIRASLRQYRQLLDSTLQTLRESNAKFIKSFKLFSEGGNFSPEEIEEYRKKLEKMSSMIDSTEGSIMSDLEGMESKRLEAATKIATEFEDRFKGHMNDLVFMEKISRWLTNVQTKIKSEVANSNSQAKKIKHLLDNLERRIDACEKPNLDKEVVSATKLNESLAEIFEELKDRSLYLNCVKPSALESQATTPVSAAESAKVVYTEVTTSYGKSGKHVEDPSVGVIKSIMNKSQSAKERSQKSRMRFGVEADLDGEGGSNNNFVEGLHEKSKSALSQSSSRLSDGSGRNVKKLDSDRPSQSGFRRFNRQGRFDKKSMAFLNRNENVNMNKEEEAATHFIAIIQNLLKEASNGLLATAEVYYKHKGPRAVTRPQAVPETYDQFHDTISQKLHSYFQQSEEYHNQCLQEYRSQLERMEQLSSLVPGLVYSDLLTQEVNSLDKNQADASAQFKAILDELKARQAAHRDGLRPVLGHPNAAQQLSELCEREKERHDQYKEAVEAQTQAKKEALLQHSKLFLESLVNLSEKQFLQYDAMTIVDNVEIGKIEQKCYPTTELLRRKLAGEPVDQTTEVEPLTRGKATWIGLPSNQFVVGERPSKLTVAPSVLTKKSTKAHHACNRSRDKTYEDYKESFEKTLLQIEQEREELLASEQRWKDSWFDSVEKIKNLYQS